VKTRTILAAVVSGAVAAAIAPQARAGLVPVSRASSIRLDATAGADEFHQNRSTDQFGRFNESLSHEGSDPNGAHVTGSVSQDTTVDVSNPSQIFGSGSLAAHAFGEFTGEGVTGPVAVRGDSNFTLQFQVTDQPEQFTVNGMFGTLNFRGPTASLSLSNDDPDNQFSLLIDNDTQHTNQMNFDRDFQIPPGNYTMTAMLGAGSSGSGPSDPRSFGEDTSMNFTFSVGSAATAIPLPAGVWTGGCGLLAAMGAAGFSRRRRLA
jgi:hypothetical protein